MRIEDYGLIGDMETAALVGRDGAVDWLCLPRFDSPSCFSALLGDEWHGRWRLAPAGDVRASSRRYRSGTLVLETVLALEALLTAGYSDEALAFRDFMVRAGTGDPSKLQIMYGIGGERRLTEFELEELPGYEGSKPVRIGNAASEQFQLDVYGEVVAVAFLGAEILGRLEKRLWPRWRNAVEYVETIWRQPDDGIW